MQKPFEVGDDVALVDRNPWRRAVAILWRSKVEKVHKTGAVVTDRGKYRADGWPYGERSRIVRPAKLEHVTPELLAEVEASAATHDAEMYLGALADRLRKLRDGEAVSMAEKLRAVLPEGV